MGAQGRTLFSVHVTQCDFSPSTSSFDQFKISPQVLTMKALISILQDRDAFVKEIAEGVNLRRKLLDLNAIAATAFGIYGAIIGSQHSLLEALSSGLKLPVLFLLTTAICMPTLFIFSSFFGSKRSILQTLVLLATGNTIISLALVGFAPITLFFIVTTHSYQFFKLL